MAKNSNGEGSIYRRMRDGKLVRSEGAISYLDEDGKTKRHTVYGRTRADVRDKLKTARERLEAGAPVRDASQTVGAWLAQLAGDHAGRVRSQGLDARALRATCAATIWSPRRSVRSGWTGCGPATSRRWCWRCGRPSRAVRTVRLDDPVDLHRAAGRPGRCGARRTAGTQSRGPGEAPGRRAQEAKHLDAGDVAAVLEPPRVRATTPRWC